MHNQIIGIIGIILGLAVCFIKSFSNWIQFGRAEPVGKKRLNESNTFASEKSKNIIRIVIGILIIVLGIIIFFNG